MCEKLPETLLAYRTITAHVEAKQEDRYDVDGWRKENRENSIPVRFQKSTTRKRKVGRNETKCPTNPSAIPGAPVPHKQAPLDALSCLSIRHN